MKKITSLLILFLLFVGLGVQAQRIAGLNSVPTEKTLPANLTTGYYLLKQVNKVTNDVITDKEAGYGYIRAKEESVGSMASSVGSDTNPEEAVYIWYVEVKDPAKHHIKISTANKIASWHLPENAQRVKPLVAYDEGTTMECVMEQPAPLGNVEVGPPAAGSCFLRNLEKKAYVHFSGNDLGSWTDSNLNSLYMVEFYKIPESSLKTIGQVEVNYTYYLNDVVIGKTKQKADIGASYNAPRLNIGYLKYSYLNNDTVSVTNCNVDVICTENLPFQKTESFANKEDLLKAKWYYMTIANQKYYLSHQKGDKIELKTTKLDVVPEDNYKWCFVGNAYEGFKIYNKATGMSKVLSSSLTMKGTTGAGTHPVMTDESSILGSTNNLRWDLTESENGSGDIRGSYWAQHGQSSHKMNNRGNVLAYWTGGADGGSTFTFIEAPSDDKLIDNYKKVNQAIVGYVGGYTEEQFARLNTITTASKLRDFIATEQTITIQPGGYYRLKNVGMKHMLSARVNSTDVASLQVNSDLTQLQTNIDFLWQFKVNGSKYQLRHLNLDRYVTNPGKSNLQGGAGADYEFIPLGDAQYAMKCIVDDKAEFLFEFDNKTLGSSGSAGKNGAGSWYIKPVNKIQLDLNQVGTSSEYWSSLYLPFSVALPSGLEAYWGTCVAGKGGDDIGSLVLKKLNVVPANTGVLLKGCQKNYQLDINDANIILDNNCLRGTNKELPLFYSFDGHEESMSNSYFTLGYMSATGVGFYHPTGKYLKANRAYIPVAVNPILVKGYRLVFDDDDEVTGVDQVEIENGQAADVYYDLSGRLVLHPKKGVYIKNGKKVYVK